MSDEKSIYIIEHCAEALRYCAEQHPNNVGIGVAFSLAQTYLLERERIEPKHEFLPMDIAPKDEPILLKMIGYAAVGSWFETKGEPGWWVSSARPVEPIGWYRIPETIRRRSAGQIDDRQRLAE